MSNQFTVGSVTIKAMPPEKEKTCEGCYFNDSSIPNDQTCKVVYPRNNAEKIQANAAINFEINNVIICQSHLMSVYQEV